MSNSSLVPGDDQLPQSVGAWVQKHIGSHAVMVARNPLVAGIEFSLVEVALVTTTGRYLLARGLGVFYTNGLMVPAQRSSARLLIPTPPLIEWATGSALYVDGKSVPYTRRTPSMGLLRRKLFEQMKSDGISEVR